jgi:molybdopterin-guanine dinucleotide biosynthesis protein A
VELRGRPLISYPLSALQAALGDVAIIVKPDTILPNLPGVTVWIEPAAPTHPLTGLIHALAFAEGRAVFACAADLPFVTAALVSQIAGADPRGAPAVIAAHGRQVQPLLGCYQTRALELLRGVPDGTERRLRDVVAEIGARTTEVADPDQLFNVNAPEDLLQAAAMLDRRGPISRM